MAKRGRNVYLTKTSNIQQHNMYISIFETGVSATQETARSGRYMLFSFYVLYGLEARIQSIKYLILLL